MSGRANGLPHSWQNLAIATWDDILLYLSQPDFTGEVDDLDEGCVSHDGLRGVEVVMALPEPELPFLPPNLLFSSAVEGMLDEGTYFWKAEFEDGLRWPPSLCLPDPDPLDEPKSSSCI